MPPHGGKIDLFPPYTDDKPFDIREMMEDPVICTNILLFIFHASIVQGGTFWQLTDIHFDYNYSRTGDINHNCHGHDVTDKKLGLYGDSNCDSNVLLLHDSVNAMKKILPNPDFILWTGDNYAHIIDQSQVDFDMIFASIRNTTQVITNAFPRTRIVPVLGNYDVVPTPHFPWSTFEKYSHNYLTVGGWGKLIPLNQHKNWKKGGYYVVKINHKLKILVLNTFIYGMQLKDEGDDPKGQFKWLEKELKLSERNKNKVIITSHVPPVQIFLAQPYLDKLLSLIHQFQHIIMTQIFAHLHKDTFKLYYDSNGNVSSYVFLGPSVSPYATDDGVKELLNIKNYKLNKINPCVRYYTYCSDEYNLLDYQQHCLDFAKANKMAEEGKWPPGEWKLLYKATEAYGVPNLSVSSVGEIYNKIKNNRAVFDIYLKNFLSGFDGNDCDDNCRKFHLCFIVNVTKEQERYCEHFDLKNSTLII